ncbi:MAG: ribosome biogenesis GTP-binding protein YihA/YsxC [Lachnospiraceae bacterium]|nr:ribosome biogenesis GTP-binding protein YihA/YsxC [Lachnospiraceae bacterium]
MNVHNVELETVCGITSKVPDNELLEIGFAGKSNVGKSSLINALINRKSFARTSAQPGKTQTINFYKIENKLYFVDLPGYGYAKVSKEVREKWGKLIEKYLLNSKQLRIIFLLVDIRHEPGTNDVEMYKWITYYGFNPVIIATKADKLSKNQINKSVSVIRKKLNLIEGTPIIPFSSVTRQGKEEVWNFIDEYLLQFNEEETEE